MASKIEWTEKTWNPVTGCTKVSPGCDNCYAERMAGRLAAMGQKKYQATVGTLGYMQGWNGTTFCDEKALEIPLHWRKPRMIFVCSMGDLPLAPYWFFVKVMTVIKRCQQHTFQILTKRPEMLLQYCTSLYKHGTPPKNLWLGVTAENQEQADKRIPILLQTPAAVRFVSIEPMLGPVNICPWITADDKEQILNKHNLAFLDWVILGGESGPGARPMHPDWARSVRDQCVAAGVPFFFKQWGAWGIAAFQRGEKELSLVGGSIPLKGSTPFKCFPENINATVPLAGWVRVGKKKAGRLLDGKEYSEYPKGGVK